MLENIEKQPIVYVHAYMGSRLCTQLVLICVQLDFMLMRAYSYVRIFVLEFIRMRFPT